jgi:hypothetical protein
MGLSLPRIEVPQGAHMSDEPKKESPELAEDDLSQVTGGLLEIEGIKGESQDDKHKDEIHVDSI